MQREHQLLFLKSELKLIEQLIESNQIIYEKTLLIYREGKIPYKDVEVVFFELQTLNTEKLIKELDLLLNLLIR